MDGAHRGMDGAHRSTERPAGKAIPWQPAVRSLGAESVGKEPWRDGGAGRERAGAGRVGSAGAAGRRGDAGGRDDVSGLCLT